MTWHTCAIATVVDTIDTDIDVIFVVAVDAAAGCEADSDSGVGVGAVVFVSSVDAVVAAPVVAVEDRKGQGQGACFVCCDDPAPVAVVNRRSRGGPGSGIFFVVVTLFCEVSVLELSFYDCFCCWYCY